MRTNYEYRNDLYRLALELAQVQVVVETFFIQQFLVGALLDDLAVIDHQDVVGIPDGAQAVGDDEAGASGHQAQQGLLDAGLGARVHAAGGFVEDQDCRVGQDGAGDGEQLALSLTEVAGAFREQGIIAVSAVGG